MKFLTRIGSALWVATSLAWGGDVGAGAEHKAEQDALSGWKAHAEKLSRDPSVVRFYSFQEGAGDGVANAARNQPEGSLALVNYSPYGLYRGIPGWPAPAPEDCTRWTKGRWAGKNALECGLAPRQVIRSKFYGTPQGTFTAEAWVRMHELGEHEWGDSPLFGMDSAYQSGWQVIVERKHWCREGSARFVLGTPSGPVSTRFGEGSKFTFGVWHYLAVVWDGREIRLQIDGTTLSQPATGPFVAPKQPKELENDIGALSLGGGLRFDIDELVIYDRVLAPDEIAEHARNFRPVDPDDLQREKSLKDQAEREALARVEFKFPRQSGGYFTVGKPLNVAVHVPTPGLADAHTAKFILVSKETGAKVYEKERTIQSKENKGANARFSITATHCGLFTAILSIQNAKRETLRKEEFPIGFTVPLPSESTGKEFILGVQHSTVPQPEARPLGVTWARVVLDWNSIEPQKGIYSWEEADRTIETATESGLRILCCVTGWPAWLPLNADQPRLPSELESYQTFLRILANRYRSNRLEAWEIWDAPAGPPQFKFRDDPGASAYAAVAQAAVEAIRREAPQAKILGAGVPGDANFFATWPLRAIPRDGKSRLDGIAYQNAPAAPAAPKESAALHAAVSASNGRALLYWNTACAYLQPAGSMAGIEPGAFDSLYPGRVIDVDSVKAVAAWPYTLFSAKQSAIRQVQQILLERASGANALFLASGANDYYPAWNTSDGNPSEKGLALAMLNSVLGDAISVTEIKITHESRVKVLRLNRPHAKPTLVILPRGKIKLKVNLPGEKIGAMDWLGNPVALGASDDEGNREISLDETPLYLFTAKDPKGIEAL